MIKNKIDKRRKIEYNTPESKIQALFESDRIKERRKAEFMSNLSKLELSQITAEEKSLEKEIERLRKEPPRTLETVMKELDALKNYKAIRYGSVSNGNGNHAQDGFKARRNPTEPLALAMLQILTQAQKPMHINEIVKKLNDTGTASTYARAATVLSRYANKKPAKYFRYVSLGTYSTIS